MKKNKYLTEGWGKKLLGAGAALAGAYGLYKGAQGGYLGQNVADFTNNQITPRINSAVNGAKNLVGMGDSPEANPEQPTQAPSEVNKQPQNNTNQSIMANANAQANAQQTTPQNVAALNAAEKNMELKKQQQQATTQNANLRQQERNVKFRTEIVNGRPVQVPVI